MQISFTYSLVVNAKFRSICVLRLLFSALLSFTSTVFTFRLAWALSTIWGWNLKYNADLIKVYSNWIKESQRLSSVLTELNCSDRLLLWAAAPAETISWMVGRRSGLSVSEWDLPVLQRLICARSGLFTAAATIFVFRDLRLFFVEWFLTSVFSTGFLFLWSRG